MGDRGNIVIKEQGGAEIFLYSHWGGHDLPETLRLGLTRGESRWDDEAYLARIIFCEMVRDSIEGGTGYGISTTMQDNEYPLLVVDIAKQQVRAEDESTRAIRFEVGFEGYIAQVFVWDETRKTLVVGP